MNVLVVLVAIAAATPSSSASSASSAPPASSPSASPAPRDRFGVRAYVRAGHEVVVDARHDMFAVRADAATFDADDVARVVQTVVASKAPSLAPASLRVLRNDGLYAVELAHEATRTQLAAMAAAIENVDAGLHVYPALSRMTGRAFYDDALVVTAMPGKLDDVVAAVVAKTGGSFVRNSIVPHTALVRVGAAFHFDAVDASSALSSTISGLVSAEPNLYRELRTTAVTPDDPLFADQWHLSRQPSSTVPGDAQIHADEAWETTKGAGVRVAVFDTGIDVDHDDLADNMLEGFDAAADDGDPRPECSFQQDGRDVSTDHGCGPDTPFFESHGTSVSGTIAAVADNGIGVSGVCPECSIVPVRLLGDQAGTGLSIAEAFVKAVDPPFNADVINNSWGPGFSAFFPLSTAEQDAFDHARTVGRHGLGTLIFFAAGNDSSDVISDAYASNSYVVTIAASSNVDDWADYSNFGVQVDVAAPSQGDPNIDPDEGSAIVTTDVSGDDGYSADDFTDTFNGTSAACPVAVGTAALVIAVNPNLTAEQVRLVITRSADRIGGVEPWVDLGLPQDFNDFLFTYDDAGHANAFGYGRVNAAAAVALALDDDAIGNAGALCNAPGCDYCSAEGRCLTRCESQTDCVTGTVCSAELGACELPRDRPADFLSSCAGPEGGSPNCTCGVDCAACTATLDSEGAPVDICTTSCAGDDDCPDGFDCRVLDPNDALGPAICAVGDRTAGEPADFFNCSIIVTGDGGQQLCGDFCFSAGPGSCPYGFACRSADCDCAAGFGGQCFQFTCGPDDDPGNFDQNDFGFPLCLPRPGFADVCDGDFDCQAGDYCAGGHCRLDDREGCDICKQCTTDDDCLGRGICGGLQNSDVGQCLWSCEDSDPCPGDSVCREIDSRFGSFKVCLSPEGGRDEETRCDETYTCEVACRDDVPCPTGKKCEDGACVVDNGGGGGDDGPPGIAGGGCHCGASSPADVATIGAAGILAACVLRRRRRR